MKTPAAFVALAWLGLGASVPQAPARQAPMPATPAACRQWAIDAYSNAYRERQRAAGTMTSEIVRELQAARAEMAGTCAAQFDAATMAPSELPALAQLYSLAGQPDLAKAAIARAVAATGLPESTRADILVAAVTSGLAEPKADARNARLETYVDDLDRLSDAVFAQKLQVHTRMNGYYRADDIDAGIITHSTWIIAAGDAAAPADRARLASAVIVAHVNMAEAWAGQGRNDEAIALLEDGIARWGDMTSSTSLTSTLDRLKLVGTVAQPIVAPTWLNVPAGTSSLPMDGAVTLLEFTAHWCGPCRESYPGINRLRERFGAQDFRVVFVTRLWGYFGAERPLAPDAEVARDRDYFAEHGLDVPVAIAPELAPSVRNPDGTVIVHRDPNDDHYKVSGIPQIQIIDRQGRIRLIMVGYDDANEERLVSLIGDLLAEK